MTYRNRRGRDTLVIEYDRGRPGYTGRKFVDGKEAGYAIGPEWKEFFAHLGLLGLSEGELCELEEVR